MQLYDLRREAELRKARNWYMADFWPQNADDVIKVVNAFPSQENAWMRQVGGYWDMAASMVLHGAINEELFLQPGVSGDVFPFRQDSSFLEGNPEKMNNPESFANIEKVDRLKAGAQATGAHFEKRRESPQSDGQEKLTKPRPIPPRSASGHPCALAHCYPECVVRMLWWFLILAVSTVVVVSVALSIDMRVGRQMKRSAAHRAELDGLDHSSPEA